MEDRPAVRPEPQPRHDPRRNRLVAALIVMVAVAVVLSRLGTWWSYVGTGLLLVPFLFVSALLVVLEAKDGLGVWRRLRDRVRS